MALDSLFVLKVPLNPKQTNKQTAIARPLSVPNLVAVEQLLAGLTE